MPSVAVHAAHSIPGFDPGHPHARARGEGDSCRRGQTRTWWHGLCLSLAVLFIAACATPPPQQPQPPARIERAQISPAIWRLEHRGNFLYLFGTVHAGKPEYYKPFPRDIAVAFGQADVIAVEADISDRAKTIEHTRKRRYTPPERVENHLPRAVLSDLLEALPRGRATFDALRMSERRPLELATNVASLSAAFRPGELSTMHGMELPLLTLARKHGKPIVEIEGFERALHFDRLLTANQEIELLRATIVRARRGDYHDILREQFTYWERGDIDGLARAIDAFCNGSPIERTNCERMYDARHPHMVARIEEFIQSGKRHFVMVGAGHLVGRSGLLALLGERGYVVRRANMPHLNEAGSGPPHIPAPALRN